MHGLWVWNTPDVIGNETALQQLISALRTSHATAVYLFLSADDYVTMRPALSHAVAELTRAGLNVWGLEGARGYFHDAAGPADLDAAVQAMIAFNRGVVSGPGFTGFVSDLEPQDGQGPDYPVHFHNGFADRQLSSAQAADRQALMADWIMIHRNLHRVLSSAGLLYAAAFPAWTDDYDGEPVHVMLDGRRQRVTTALLPMVDTYIIMTYVTDPVRAIRLAQRPIAWADQSGNPAPKIVLALETHPGAGRKLSYADTPGMATRSAVLRDIQTITRALSRHASFAGVDIHDWVGWSALPP